MSNDELFERVKSILDSLNVQSRKMFGGIGIFSEKIMFSMIYDGVLYFRSTEEIASGYSVIVFSISILLETLRCRIGVSQIRLSRTSLCLRARAWLPIELSGMEA